MSSWTAGWWRVSEQRSGWDGSIFLFFLLLMSPVATSFPHAHLSPQTHHAAHFPMRLSTMWTSTRPPLPTHTEDNTHWEMGHVHMQSTCSASNISKLTHLYCKPRVMEPEPVVAYSLCVCDPEGEKLGFTEQITWEFEFMDFREQSYQLSLSSVRGSLARGSWICEKHFIIITTTAPPTGGDENNR